MMKRCLNRGWLWALALVAASCVADAETAKRQFLKSGDEYFLREKYPEAVIQYRNALQQDPAFGDASLKLAEALMKTGDVAAAGAAYVRAADLLPQDPDVQLKAGGLLLLRGRAEEAKARAEQALRIAPQSAKAQVLLGSALAGLKDLEAAVSEIETAIRLDPTSSTSQTMLGIVQLSRGNQESALTALHKAIELDPRSVAARMALANYYWATRQISLAEETLKATAALNPSVALPNRALAALYLSTNRPLQAEQPLRVVAETTKAPRAELLLADYYVVSGRPAEAMPILRKLAALDAYSAAAKTTLAVLERRQGRKEEAHKLLDQVLHANPKQPQALLAKAELQIAEGRRTEALATLQSASTADPRSARPRLLQARIHRSTGRLDEAAALLREALQLAPRDGEVLVELARVQLGLGAVEQAALFARDSVTARPNDAGARLVLVRALLAKGELGAAGSELEWLRTHHPAAGEAQVLSGILAARRRDATAARAAFERALQLDPRSPEALNGLVVTHLAKKEFQRAREAVDAAMARHPGTPAILLVAARAYVAQGESAGAERLLRKAVEIDASYLPAYSALGQLYLTLRKLDEARSEFDALAARTPRPVAALTISGIILQGQRRDAEARDRFERALRIDPKAAVAANNLAWMYAESGADLDKALALAQTAVAALPESAETVDTLGWVYYKKQLSSLAVSTLARSVGKDPKNPVYHYHLGLAYAQAGDAARARDSLRRALSLNASFQGAEDARRVFGELSAPAPSG